MAILSLSHVAELNLDGSAHFFTAILKTCQRHGVMGDSLSPGLATCGAEVDKSMLACGSEKLHVQVNDEKTRGLKI